MDQSIGVRRFQFDPDTLRGNHHWVTVTATDEDGHTSLFVVALDQASPDQGGTEAEASAYQQFQYRSHGARGQTEVIIGLLPRAPMQSLVRAILDPENPSIALGVSACA